jgi:predicted Zn-dependent protease
MVNAFATLGGNIVIFQGLINELDSENELAMIIAHEIAHIKNRHPIQSLGRSTIISLGLSLMIGNSATNPIENSGLLTLLKFSRDMEHEADKDGLEALNQCYGHINGATGVFEKLEKMQQEESLTVPAFLSTHPLNDERISNINSLALEKNWNSSGKLKQFPASIK